MPQVCLPCLSVRQPFVEFIMIQFKTWESRVRHLARILAKYEGRYILLHASTLTDDDQVRDALRIATRRKVPEHHKAQCKAACSDNNKIGHCLAIIKLGTTTKLSKTTCLRTQNQRTKWENRTLVRASILEDMLVTEIVEVHPMPHPCKLQGRFGVFSACVGLHDLPTDLNENTLQKSLWENRPQ